MWSDGFLGARTGDDDAAERLLRFHNHPDVRRLISATKTMGLSPRALAEYYGEVLDYVRRRTGDDDIAWRDVPFVAGGASQVRGSGVSVGME